MLRHSFLKVGEDIPLQHILLARMAIRAVSATQLIEKIISMFKVIIYVKQLTDLINM